MQALLGGVHGIDYLLFHLLLGATVFRWAVVSAGGPDGEASDPKWRSRWKALVWLTLLSSLSWMVLTEADMGDSWLPRDLWLATAHTWFGHLWCARTVALLLLAVASDWVRPDGKNLLIATAILSALALASSLSGHAASQDTGLWWRVSLDLAHSLAAGAWAGGLVSLYFWLGTRIGEGGGDRSVTLAVVHRFSRLAMASTALLLVTGLAMAWASGLPPLRPWAVPYGQFIVGKAAFFGIALLAAAVNQFQHLRRPAKSEVRFAAGLRREVRLEIFCVIVVFLIAGFLSRTSLPTG